MPAMIAIKRNGISETSTRSRSVLRHNVQRHNLNKLQTQNKRQEMFSWDCNEALQNIVLKIHFKKDKIFLVSCAECCNACHQIPLFNLFFIFLSFLFFFLRCARAVFQISTRIVLPCSAWNLHSRLLVISLLTRETYAFDIVLLLAHRQWITED